VAELGAGPAPIPRAQLSSSRLALALSQAIEGGAMRERASALGRRLADERGVERAVELVGCYLAG
jgi:hypothetical protein